MDTKVCPPGSRRGEIKEKGRQRERERVIPNSHGDKRIGELIDCVLSIS